MSQTEQPTSLTQKSIIVKKHTPEEVLGLEYTLPSLSQEAMNLQPNSLRNMLAPNGEQTCALSSGYPWTRVSHYGDIVGYQYLLNLEKGASEKFATYGPTPPEPQFRDTLQQVLKKDGINVSKEQIFISGAGSQNLIDLSMRCLVQPHETTVLLQDPYYAGAQSAIYSREPRSVEAIPTKESGRIDLDALKDLVIRSKKMNPSVVAYFSTDNANPTGSSWTPEEVDGVAELAEKYGIWLINDLAYKRLHYQSPEGEKTPSLQEKAPNHTITIRSFSKEATSPSSRIGYIAVPPLNNLPEKFLLALQTNILYVPQDRQLAHDWYIKNKFDSHINDVLIPLYDTRTQELDRAVQQYFPEGTKLLGNPDHRGGIFRMTELSEGYDVTKLIEPMFEDTGVLILPGYDFTVGDEKRKREVGGRRIRLGVGMTRASSEIPQKEREHTIYIAEGIRRAGSFLKTNRP